MSSLNYLHKLLDSVEVAWRPLADVVEFKRGEQLKPIDIVPGSYPIVTASKTEVGSHSEWNFGPLSVTVTSHGAYAGHVNYWPTPIWLANNVFLLSPISQLNPKFLYFFLKSNELKIQGLAKGGGVPYFNTRDLAPLLIPIPSPDNPQKSLEIQAEIVRILDAFTELTAELAAELTARKKQYNYYRDQLLSFEDGEVEWRSLDEVASFRRGSFPQPYGNKEWYDGEGCMPFVQVADVADAGFALNKVTKQKISRVAQAKSVFVKAGTVLVTLQGTIGRVAIAQYDCYVDRTLAIFTSYKTDIDKKYFAYQLKAKFDLEKECARGSTLKTITKEEFSEFQIPIPPLAEQARIVSILDKFDDLTNSITEGLPREIELRQKQYAYYRDLLLSFPKPEEVEA